MIIFEGCVQDGSCHESKDGGREGFFRVLCPNGEFTIDFNRCEGFDVVPFMESYLIITDQRKDSWMDLKLMDFSTDKFNNLNLSFMTADEKVHFSVTIPKGVYTSSRQKFRLNTVYSFFLTDNNQSFINIKNGFTELD